MAGKIRTLIVDDSASVRQTLASILSSDPEIEVIGTASDPFVAARRIHDEVPDVITLDVEMPHMDGITFLRKLMSQHPVPVVMCSSLTEEGSETLMLALEAGAVDVILKPRIDAAHFLMEAKVRICDAVKGAARARLRQFPKSLRGDPDGIRVPAKKLTADVMLAAPNAGQAMARTTETIICIGASTGGTESLRVLLEALPADSPPILIVQHMPALFTTAFAARLDSVCPMRVVEAVDDQPLKRGVAYIARGDFHLLVAARGVELRTVLQAGPPLHYQRPSVDVLFQSAANLRGVPIVALLLTGMGSDGADGMVTLRQSGAVTIAEAERSCVVFGMPAEAIARGGAMHVATLLAMPRLIADSFAQRRTRRLSDPAPALTPRGPAGREA